MWKAVSRALVLLIFSAPTYAGDQHKIIHVGELLAVPGEPTSKEQSIIIEDGKILDIRAGYLPASGEYDGATIIDLKDQFVMPGMMDMHVHLAIQYGGYEPNLLSWNGSDAKVKLSLADVALNGSVYAKRTLEAGFTTVRDLGTIGDASLATFALRDAIDAGKIPGPRMFVSGAYLSATSGHGDHEGFRVEVMDTLASSGVCDGVAECRKAVRTQVKRGATAIKFMATGGGGEENGGPEAEPEFFPEEMKAIVDTAHSFDRVVAAHAHGRKGIIAALKAGADSIEHSSWLDDEAISLYKETGAVIHPTLSVHTKILAVADQRPLGARKVIQAKMQKARDNFARAYKAGVTFGLGSDAGVFPHGMNAMELEWLVKIGLSPMEALVAATKVPAKLMRIEDQLGTLEAGKIADLIATDGSPLADITELQDVQFVMKEGEVYKSSH